MSSIAADIIKIFLEADILKTVEVTLSGGWRRQRFCLVIPIGTTQPFGRLERNLLMMFDFWCNCEKHGFRFRVAFVIRLYCLHTSIEFVYLYLHIGSIISVFGIVGANSFLFSHLESSQTEQL